jgi:N-acetyl-alpha-D-muramate 1-phosphate uridylyltransferase
MNLFPAAILAGGLATRLRPLTQSMPKSLVEINGEPFIAHQLRLLSRHRVSEIILCIGFLGKQIRDFVGDGTHFGVQVQYSEDVATQLGTAGAIRKALGLLPDSFFVLYGDSYLTCSFETVQAAFLAAGKAGLMTVFANHGRWDTSNVEFAQGQIVAYDKNERTARMQHIDYGLGVFRKEAFAKYPLDRSMDLAYVYKELSKQGELSAFEVSERFYEIGSFEGISELSRFLSSAPR